MLFFSNTRHWRCTLRVGDILFGNRIFTLRESGGCGRSGRTGGSGRVVLNLLNTIALLGTTTAPTGRGWRGEERRVRGPCGRGGILGDETGTGRDLTRCTLGRDGTSAPRASGTPLHWTCGCCTCAYDCVVLTRNVS